MRTTRTGLPPADLIPDALRAYLLRRAAEVAGLALLALVIATALALASWSVRDPSINHAADGPIRNLMGLPGSLVSDLMMQLIGLAGIALLGPLAAWGWRLARRRALPNWPSRLAALLLGTGSAAVVAAALPQTDRWPLPTGLGGAVGDGLMHLAATPFGGGIAQLVVAGTAFLVCLFALHHAVADGRSDPVPARARRQGRDMDGSADDEPGFALVAVGAIVHGAAAFGAGLRRVVRFVGRRGAPAIAARARSLAEEVTRTDQSAIAGRVRIEPRLDRAPAPSYRAAGAPIPPPATAMRLVQAPEPAPPRSADRPGYAIAVANLQEMARRRLGLKNAAPRDLSDGEAAVEDGSAATTGEPSEPTSSTSETTTSQSTTSQTVARSEQAPLVSGPPATVRASRRAGVEAQPSLFDEGRYQLPPLALLAEPKRPTGATISHDALEQNARLLEGVLEDFGVRGEIINVRPGPVVTLYELEPAPGVKSSRVIGLADDIARSMSAISCRVAVVPGRNAIGIELPNQRREMVYFRELIGSEDFDKSRFRLALALGKTIGGEPVIAELAKMPHLLVAGTTGSGKSVAINTMILSLLYRLTPEQCRLIMIDPKMLELSVYDGIPHLLSPVVTDPKKAIIALKWAVREMEDRYRKMSRLGVRNIDGFNARVQEAKAAGETLSRTVDSGFDPETGEIIQSTEEMSLEPLPYIVVIIDEMADLMMVAGKDIEGAVQRLAQMARAAGIHVIMATQRPSVDVITGTIKANFPTRISFQVTSKIDSRTILGEQGAEQLLGQGDMLHMAGGGRISRVHGPFVSDDEVEKVVAHLKTQGRPQYLDAITQDEDETPAETDGAVFDRGSVGEEGGDLYDQAVRVVLRDRKASTSYIQRRLQIGYNRAASLMERMEKEGVVGSANHAGKREILVEAEDHDAG